MSARYPVAYYSASKDAYVQIDEMATPHIANALRKLDDPDRPQPEDADKIKECMTEELVSRGCTLGDDGRWMIPEKEEAQP